MTEQLSSSFCVLEVQKKNYFDKFCYVISYLLLLLFVWRLFEGLPRFVMFIKYISKEKVMMNSIETEFI
jgi:hypothetical protein